MWTVVNRQSTQNIDYIKVDYLLETLSINYGQNLFAVSEQKEDILHQYIICNILQDGEVYISKSANILILGHDEREQKVNYGHYGKVF